MNSPKNARAGVTLIEMLVVVVIIAVFAAVVGPRLLNQGDKARVVAAKQQIENFGLALGQYHLDTGGYPSTEQGLQALRVQPSGEVLVTDGPYLEAKEHVGGLSIIEAADMDEALSWALKGAKACRASGEVREIFFRPSPNATQKEPPVPA